MVVWETLRSLLDTIKSDIALVKAQTDTLEAKIDTLLVKHLASVKGADSNTTGVKVSYTVPTGKTAHAKEVRITRVVGTPTFATEVVKGADTYTITSGGAVRTDSLELGLAAGDIIRVNVTAIGGASSVIDVLISGSESQ